MLTDRGLPDWMDINGPQFYYRVRNERWARNKQQNIDIYARDVKTGEVEYFVNWRDVEMDGHNVAAVQSSIRSGGTCGGLQWAYSPEFRPVRSKGSPKMKTVCIKYQGGLVFNYRCLEDAAKDLGCSKTQVSNVAYGRAENWRTGRGIISVTIGGENGKE